MESFDWLKPSIVLISDFLRLQIKYSYKCTLYIAFAAYDLHIKSPAKIIRGTFNFSFLYLS